jgi:hypothetical protein
VVAGPLEAGRGVGSVIRAGGQRPAEQDEAIIGLLGDEPLVGLEGRGFWGDPAEVDLILPLVEGRELRRIGGKLREPNTSARRD